MLDSNNRIDDFSQGSRAPQSEKQKRTIPGSIRILVLGRHRICMFILPYNQIFEFPVVLVVVWDSSVVMIDNDTFLARPDLSDAIES